MNLQIDPSEFREVIEIAVEAAVRRMLAERLREEHGGILLDKKGAAKALSVSVSTLDRLRREANLPAVKLDNLVLFRLAALEQWAAEREETKGADA